MPRPKPEPLLEPGPCDCSCVRCDIGHHCGDEERGCEFYVWGEEDESG
jgi:hypothetical protein